MSNTAKSRNERWDLSAFGGLFEDETLWRWEVRFFVRTTSVRLPQNDSFLNRERKWKASERRNNVAGCVSAWICKARQTGAPSVRNYFNKPSAHQLLDQNYSVLFVPFVTLCLCGKKSVLSPCKSAAKNIWISNNQHGISNDQLLKVHFDEIRWQKGDNPQPRT